MFYSAENINFLNEMESEDRATFKVQNGHGLIDAYLYPKSSADLKTAYTADAHDLREGLSQARSALARDT